MRVSRFLFLGLAVAILGVAANGQVFLQEDFSTGSVTTDPAGWTQVNTGGGVNDFWHYDNPGARAVAAPPFSGQFAIFDSDNTSNDALAEDVELISPAFDASLAAFGVQLSWDQWHNPLGTSSTIEVQVLNSTTGVWTVVYTNNTGTPNADSQCLDITAATGFSTASQIKFRWQGTWDWWWAIDNVAVVDPLPFDVGVTAISAPVDNQACVNLSTNETVTVTVTNFSGTPVPAAAIIPVAYTVNGGAAVAEALTSGGLACGQSETYTFTTGADLSLPGVYTIVATTVAGDLAPGNDATTVMVDSTPGGLGTVVSTPAASWVENFDSLATNTNQVPVAWLNEQGESPQDWLTRNTNTPSTGTGNTTDHTGNGGNYMYLEDSGQQNNPVNLWTPCIDISAHGAPTFEFYLHSYDTDPVGSPSNFLAVDLFHSGGTVMDFFLSNNDVTTGGINLDGWQKIRLDLSPYIGSGIVQLRFRGSTADPTNDFDHDQLIDDVRVFESVAVDLGVESINGPADGTDCVALGLSTIDITLVNDGATTIPMGTSVTVAYDVDLSGFPVIENIVLAADFDPCTTLNYAFLTQANITTIGPVQIDATVLFGDANPGNDTATRIVNSGLAPIPAPFTEDFDGFTTGTGQTQVPPAGWINDPADAGTGVNFDWNFRSTPTTSTGTGNTQDFTNPGTGNYAYVEDGGTAADVNLITPCIDLSTIAAPALVFQLHSWDVDFNGPGGPNENSLDIEVNDGTGWSAPIATFGCNLFDGWFRQVVDLSAYAGQTVQIRFSGRTDNMGNPAGSGTTATDFQHDILIDAVFVGEAPLNGTGEDFIVRTQLNGAGDPFATTKIGNVADLLSAGVESPLGTFDGLPPILAAQIGAPGTLPLPGALLADVALDFSAVIVFDGTVPTPLGQTLLGPGGINLSFFVPPATSGFVIRFQGLLVHPSTANGIYASTDPHDITIN